MAPIPTPEQFEAELKELIQALGYLAHEYRWCHGVAYSRQIVEQAQVSGGRPDRDGDMLRAAANGERVQAQKSVAFEHSALRDSLRFTVKKVRRVHSDIDAKVDLLRAGIEKDERRHGPTFDPLRMPRTASRKDLEESREARSRRRERGEDIP